jgi:hypothetical protein
LGVPIETLDPDVFMMQPAEAKRPMVAFLSLSLS